MPVTHSMIVEAKLDLESLQRQYLLRFGWEETSQTPGSFWLWRRDFAVEDAARRAWDEAHGAGKPGKPSPSTPYGLVTANMDLAVSMTVAVLDEQAELGEEEG